MLFFGKLIVKKIKPEDGEVLIFECTKNFNIHKLEEWLRRVVELFPKQKVILLVNGIEFKCSIKNEENIKEEKNGKQSG